ncbi:MAG: hypothetical protein GY869_12285 [Planctomycetes bacterium]|nr:hypothetical protein [Planctomycetota bacterium]
MDRKKFRKKFLLALLSSPLTLFPLVGGISLSILLAALSKGALAIISLLGGLGIGLGFLSQSWILNRDKIAKRIYDEIEVEKNQEREKALNELDEALTGDRDPRTQASLRDLRALYAAFKNPDTLMKGIDTFTSYSISTTVNEIFDQCVRSLRETLKLLEEANQAGSKTVRNALLERRADLITNVQAGIVNLNETIAKIGKLGFAKKKDPRLANLGQELLDQLEVAKRVDARISGQVNNFEGLIGNDE